MNNVIVIPIYKLFLNRFEIVSLKRCLSILKKHTIIFVTYEDLDVSFYLNMLSKAKVGFCFEYFEKKYFENLETYNQLMTSLEFYERFSQYDYMLIYQLDAYVFRDDLDFWCEKDYTYIGAPLPSGIILSKKKRYLNDFKSELDINMFFNGGFSLRKISSFINIIKSKNELIKEFLKKRWYEDVIFSILFYNSNVANSPTLQLSMKFSFECNPSELYIKNERKLPMGCHAWYRNDGGIYDNMFWFKHIMPFYYLILRIKENSSYLYKKSKKIFNRLKNYILRNV
jgi:hypothetical protein